MRSYTMHKFIVPALLVAMAGILPADVLSLRDGRALNGRLINASSRQIQFQEDGQRTAKSYSLTNVDRVSFGNTAAVGSSAASNAPVANRARTGAYSIPAGSV